MECCCNICCQPFQTDSTDLKDSGNFINSSEPNNKGEINGLTTRSKKILSCNHVLCESCYLRLDKTYCPYCRKVFTYSRNDIIKRNKLNLNYKWQPPSQISNYIPPDTNISTIPTVIVPSNNSRNRSIEPSEPFSRVRKNMIRRRRRNLSFDEVLERRKVIRRRCQMKWMRKNGRLEKESASSIFDD